MRNLSLDQLHTLQLVAKLGSFSAAARRLNLTQPAVSLQIKELEDRFGIRLLERIGKRAYPTPPGKALLEHAGRFMDEANRTQATMRRHKEGKIGRVSVGTGNTAVTYLLPPVLKKLRAEYPEIEIVVATGSTAHIVEQMAANAVQLGFVTLPVDEREFYVLRVRKEPLVAILPPNAANPPKAVSPADAASRPLIMEFGRANQSRLTGEWMHRAGYQARPIMELDNVEAIKRVVASGLGMSIIPAGSLDRKSRSDFLVRPLEPPLVRTLALVWRKDRPLDEAGVIVRDAIAKLTGTRAPGARKSSSKKYPR